MFSFGSGVLLGVRTDITGSTPVNFGLVQEVDIDVAFTNKMLYGQNQFPVAVGRGTAKVTGKAKMARISGLAMASLFYGVVPQAGQLATSFAEAAVVPAATPFTVTAANAATFVDDYGPIYAATGLPFEKVTGTPTIGQYSVTSAGVYTFAAADAGAALLLNYTYTITATGQQFTVASQLLGSQPFFQAQFYTTYEGVPMNVKIKKAVSAKLTFQTKLEDFVIPEIDFDILADAAGNVFEYSFGEVS